MNYDLEHIAVLTESGWRVAREIKVDPRVPTTGKRAFGLVGDRAYTNERMAREAAQDMEDELIAKTQARPMDEDCAA